MYSGNKTTLLSEHKKETIMTLEELIAAFNELKTQVAEIATNADNTELISKIETIEKSIETQTKFNTDVKEKYDKAINHILEQPKQKEVEQKPERTFDPYTGIWSDEE